MENAVKLNQRAFGNDSLSANQNVFEGYEVPPPLGT